MTGNIFKTVCFALALALAGSVSCKRKPAGDPIPPVGRLEYYNFDPAAPLADRIGRIPDKLLDYFRQLDGRRDYRAYTPTAPEKALTLEYLALLPPVYAGVFNERCVGLYFVPDFMGNGATSWVLDRDGRVYFNIVLNPAVLKDDLSKTLTQRERSCFRPGPGPAVEVDAGEKYKGLAYALFHEGTHAVDYVKGVTPWADADMPVKYRPSAPLAGRFFYRVWSDYSTPKPYADIKGRKDITFYGLGGGPRLRPADSPALYAGLAESPYISLYGTKSWAEDLAELVSFYMITRELNQPYIITLRFPGGGETRFEPMSGAAGPRAGEMYARMKSL